MSVVALVVAFALIAAGGGLVARVGWAAAPRGRAGALERLWIVLPAGFLALLLALAARALWS